MTELKNELNQPLHGQPVHEGQPVAVSPELQQHKIEAIGMSEGEIHQSAPGVLVTGEHATINPNQTPQIEYNPNPITPPQHKGILYNLTHPWEMFHHAVSYNVTGTRPLDIGAHESNHWLKVKQQAYQLPLEPAQTPQPEPVLTNQTTPGSEVIQNTTLAPTSPDVVQSVSSPTPEIQPPAAVQSTPAPVTQ